MGSQEGCWGIAGVQKPASDRDVEWRDPELLNQDISILQVFQQHCCVSALVQALGMARDDYSKVLVRSHRFQLFVKKSKIDNQSSTSR